MIYHLRALSPPHIVIAIHNPEERQRELLCPLCSRHDTPGTDDVVGVTGEQGLAVGAPGQAHALRLTALLADSGELGLELVNLALLLKVKDDDAAGSGSAEPVAVGREDEGVDLVVGVEGVEVLGLVKIPEHGRSVLATGSAERAVGGDGDGVDVAGVADVVGLQLAGGELPDLELPVLAHNVHSESGYKGQKKRWIRGCEISALVNSGLMACKKQALK